MAKNQNLRRYGKVFKYLFLISSVFLFMNFKLELQFFIKEKINAFIKELIPTCSLKRTYKNLDIIGFDILDKNGNQINSPRYRFSSGDPFSIVLYGKRKITEGKMPEENKLERCMAILEHENGGYFWSAKTSYFFKEQEIAGILKEWQIGGIYKVQFTFKVPEFSLPGKYILILIQEKEKSNHPNLGMMIKLNEIKITTKRPKAYKKEKIEDYNLSIEECLINPAIIRKKIIEFPWTGNIKFYIDKDLKNYKKIIINAKGSPALGVYPLLKVYVDHTEVGNVYVNREWKQYEFNLKVDKESHILKIRFDNNIPNRAMYINMIKLLR